MLMYFSFLCSVYWSFFSKTVPNGGVLYGYNEQLLILNGFTKCYDQPYSSPTTSMDLSNCSDSQVVFVGAKQSNVTINIGAFGSFNIFSDTVSRTTAYYDPGGAYWYRYPSSGFGFASSSSVQLYDLGCDYSGGSNDCASRLCWNLDFPYGGYRAGCSTGLEADTMWRKVIYKGSTTSCLYGKIITTP